MLINPLFHNLLCKLWFDYLRVDVATMSARHEALRMSFCISTTKVAAGSLECGWFAGVVVLVVLVLTLFSISVAVNQTRRLHISASFHLKLSNFSFLSCLLFVHLLSELQIPKSERPAEEWQGKPQEKNHHVPPHTHRNSEKVKKKKKKKSKTAD